MFDSRIYIQRRKALKSQIKEGLILFLGNEESPMNYPANPYPFRQESTFLYFFGLDSPGLSAVVDVDEDEDIIYGDDVDMEGIIWMGYLPSLKERASASGIELTAPSKELEEKLKNSLKKGKKIHWLPPYRPEAMIKLEQLLGIHPRFVQDYASEAFIRAVVEQRSVKIEEEIKEIENALGVTSMMHKKAMAMTRPGIYEREIVGRMEGIALSQGCRLAFPPIFTIRGQILHNREYGNLLEKGCLIVNDSGAESSKHYASDITRTFPVDGKFSQKQKDVYSIVLRAQEEAIRLIRPGIKYKEIHLQAATVMAEGLKELGLMKGDPKEAVEKGAHALFFPHGLGHMLGLDVHDMENLGEKYVGYDNSIERSEQFGLAYLRLARELKAGFVLTVEPGIYFIPALIDKWVKEKKFDEHIDYQKVDEYRDFGGIRIEDNLLVTEEGCRILGDPIPKKIEEIEEIIGSSPEYLD